jgi:hypothetical protein
MSFQPMPKACINHTLRIDRMRKTSWGRAIVTPVVLLAFLLQVFAVQTHVHLAMPSGAASTSVPFDGRHAAKNSGDTDTTHCPWCQAVLSSGQYLTPTALPIALPVAVRFLDPIALPARVAISAFSHGWQSRAPPAL